MRSLGIIGVFVVLIVLVALLDHASTKSPPEPDIMLASRFLIVAIGTSSALLSTVQIPPAPVRITRCALSPQRRVRRYTHEMIAVSLAQELDSTFPSNVSRSSGAKTSVRRLISRCTHIPSLDSSRWLKARSVGAVCLRRGWRRV